MGIGRAREEEKRNGDQEPRVEHQERREQREPRELIIKMTGLYRKENLGEKKLSPWAEEVLGRGQG